MPRILAAILLIAVLVIGGGLIATTAYQAGLGTAITIATGSAGTVVAPVVVPAYGYGYGPGWHAGFGFFGFLGTLLFVFIVFALVRAILWRGGPGRRGWGPGVWGGYGYGEGPNGHGHSHGPWESRANEAFDEWHRRAHGETAPPEPTDPTRPAGTA